MLGVQSINSLADVGTDGARVPQQDPAGALQGPEHFRFPQTRICFWLFFGLAALFPQQDLEGTLQRPEHIRFPKTPNPKTEALNTEHKTPHTKDQLLNPEPSTLNLKPSTPNPHTPIPNPPTPKPQPQTLNAKPSSRIRDAITRQAWSSLRRPWPYAPPPAQKGAQPPPRFKTTTSQNCEAVAQEGSYLRLIDFGITQL